MFGVFEGRTDYSIQEQRKIIFDIVRYSSNPHQTLSNLEKFPLNVMDRVSYEMKGLNYEDNEKKIKDKSIQKIISIICHPNHIKQEFQGFLIAWDGSIEFQKNNGNNDLADISLDMKSALSFIAKLFPSLIELLMEDYPNK